MREIKIKAVLNGWTVQVGCQTVVYINQGALLNDLGDYMKNPNAKEKEFIDSAINKRLMTEGCLPPDAVGAHIPVANFCEPR